jgi:excisionase family DNA binding protein
MQEAPKVTAQLSEKQRDVLAELAGKLFADVPETAEVLRIDQRTVRRSIEAGDIPAIRTGQRWRVPTSWLRQAAGLETSEAGH